MIWYFLVNYKITSTAESREIRNSPDIKPCTDTRYHHCNSTEISQWCGIIHCYWWTASIKPRLLFARAGYSSWGLSFHQFNVELYVASIEFKPVKSMLSYFTIMLGMNACSRYQELLNVNSWQDPPLYNTCDDWRGQMPELCCCLSVVVFGDGDLHVLIYRALYMIVP